MIELLISLLVASIVIMGIFSFISSTQRSFNFVQANDGMNRSMQMTNRNITDYINMAGFRNFRRVFDGVLMKKKDYKFPSGATAYFGENSFLAADVPDSSEKQVHSIYLRYYGSSIDDDQINSVTNNVSNQRMFDCDGDPLARNQLAVVHLFIETDKSGNKLGLRCEQIVDKETDTGSHSQDSKSVLISPDIQYMMFSFREDGNPEFLLPNEMLDGKEANDPAVLRRYSNVNGIKFGFITKQSTHQKLNSLQVGNLVYHVLGDVDGDDDKVTIPQTEQDAHDLYNLISGVIYTKNRYVEESN